MDENDRGPYLSPHEIETRSQRLLKRIREAWRGVHLGRGISIEDAELEIFSPRESVARRKKHTGDKEYMRQFSDWTAVDLESNAYEMPIDRPFEFLDPEAFRYYIPVFIRSWLQAGLPAMQNYDESRVSRDPEERLSWFMLCHTTDVEYVQGQARRLNGDQRRCVAEFFALALESGIFPDDEDWPAVMKLWGKDLDEDHVKRLERLLSG
ncbi:MAG: DUF6714 family protein [Planctomycetota bacterium]